MHGSQLASFKEGQRPDRSDAASHMDAAVWAQMARSDRSDAALRLKELKSFFRPRALRTSGKKQRQRCPHR